MRRGMVGEEAQRLRRRPPRPGGKRWPISGLRARLVGERAEAEAGRFGAQVDRPAGQDLGEIRHVGLGVAGGGADGVQLHALAGEVLVQAAMAALAGRAVRADRAGVVQVDQHGRVAHHRQQHVLEPAGDMRADGLLDEGAAQRGGAAADRDGEMVGPEPDQPFAERRRGGQGVLQRGARLAHDTARGRGARPSAACSAGRSAAPPAPVAVLVAAGRCGSGRLAQLVQQPGGRVGGQRFLAAAAEAEADQCLCGA